MIEIDGKKFSGGGSILRLALGFSVITNIAFKITNIRYNRSNPGIKHEHLSCILALKQLCNAEVIGDNLGSLNLTFIPNKIVSKNLKIEIPTAGSGTLVLQSLIIPLLFLNKKINVEIVCGTNVLYSPSVDYYKYVFFPQISKFTSKLEFKIIKRGYFPIGQGLISLDIKSKFKLNNDFSNLLNEIRNSNLRIEKTNQGHLLMIKIISNSSIELESKKVSERMANSARQNLIKYNVPISIETIYCSSKSIGCGILSYAIFSLDKDDISVSDPIIIGYDKIGEKQVLAEDIGKIVSNNLDLEIKSNAPVDEFMADNLIPFMALFGGTIKVSKISDHVLSNIWVVEQFLGKCFEIDEKNSVISTVF